MALGNLTSSMTSHSWAVDKAEMARISAAWIKLGMFACLVELKIIHWKDADLSDIRVLVFLHKMCRKRRYR